MLMLHIGPSIYLVLTNRLSASFLMFNITFDQISTTLYNSGKGWCTWYMYLIHVEQWYIHTLVSHFCYFVWRSKIVCSPLRSVNDQRFSCLCNVFLKSFQDCLNSVQQCQGNFAKDACQKMFIFWQTYEGLKISIN